MFIFYLDILFFENFLKEIIKYIRDFWLLEYLLEFCLLIVGY